MTICKVTGLNLQCLTLPEESLKQRCWRTSSRLRTYWRELWEPLGELGGEILEHPAMSGQMDHQALISFIIWKKQRILKILTQMHFFFHLGIVHSQSEVSQTDSGVEILAEISCFSKQSHDFGPFSGPTFRIEMSCKISTLINRLLPLVSPDVSILRSYPPILSIWLTKHTA